MKLSTRMRQIHRWVSIAFVLAVVATSIALAQPEPVIWVSYIPLAPLGLLLLTGAYMFVLPYTSRARAKAGREQ